ncbi:hypothetical protein [Aestuariivirga sp.]|jgi:hypothetical protein|uniref:hypothetical protein n=1 Tax=Aestuariivirga sp. TaxID=2650926 RepID=UPI003785080B
MTTGATEPPPCPPHSTLPPALSSGVASRVTEFRILLDRIETQIPPDLDVHIVMDNDATHKTPLSRSWLVKRPRWHVNLTPTGASWINQVARFFALITNDCIRRGIHRSTAALQDDILTYIKTHNERPKPFGWTKSADDIIATIKRFCPRQHRITETSKAGR